MVINGRDFALECELALRRLYASINRRCAVAKAAGRPHPNRSAGQFVRWMNHRDNIIKETP